MTDIKRLRYFKDEFLDTGDLEEEQNYHRDMRQRHNKVFHSWGIGHGLEVVPADGLPLGETAKVTVTTGMALDGDGKEIVLVQSRVLDFDQPRFAAGKNYYIVIRYHQQKGGPIQEEEPKEYKRWVETPDIEAVETQPQPPEAHIVLAVVTLGAGKTVTAVDDSLRKYAVFDKHVHTAADVGALAVTGGTIDGDVRVNGNVGLGTSNPRKNLHIQGKSDGIFKYDGNDRPGLAITGDYPELNLFSSYNNPDHGSTIRLGGFNDDTQTTFKHWVMGTSARDCRFLDFGFNSVNDASPHNGIRNAGGKTVLTLTDSARVGIGTTEPTHELEVAGNIKFSDTLYGPHRMHIHCQEFLYLLPIAGVKISKAWQSSGNLIVDGDSTTYGTSYAAARIGAAIDYAEYFESESGKEIGPGVSVALDRGKIRPAKEGETPIGVISANPLMAGGVHLEWPKKYLKDQFGSPIMEEYKEEIMEQGKGTGKFETKTRPRINPDYDETKEYITRDKRPEWHCVGLLGQLPLCKGQPVANSWVKIKDISDEVELWLVK
jgi:hypothetical protein